MSVIGVAAFFLLFLSGSSQQTSGPASICGVVQDQTGAVMSAIKVALTVADARIETTTSSSGQFCFSHLEPNEYQLVVQARSFRSEDRRLIVHPGESVHLTI